MKEDELVLHVNHISWTEHAWVIFPPRVGLNPCLAEAVKRAIELAFESGPHGEDCECDLSKPVELKISGGVDEQGRPYYNYLTLDGVRKAPV